MKNGVIAAKTAKQSQWQHLQDRNSGRISVIWLLLAVVVAVSLTVGACALWLPDRAPALLGSAKEITSAPAGVQEYTGATQVTMIPTVSQTRGTGTATGSGTVDGRTCHRSRD